MNNLNNFNLNLGNLSMEDFQLLLAANAANVAAQAQLQQQQQQQQRQQHRSSSNNSSEAAAVAAIAAAAAASARGGSSGNNTPTLPVSITASSTSTPRQSANNTRTPTPNTLQNGVNMSAVATAGSTTSNSTSNTSGGALDPQSQSKYQQLLSVIEEMSKDIRPTYAGSKSSAERLKRGIVYARILVRECLIETERSARN